MDGSLLKTRWMITRSTAIVVSRTETTADIDYLIGGENYIRLAESRNEAVRLLDIFVIHFGG